MAILLAVQTAFSAAAEESSVWREKADECFAWLTEQRGAEDFWDGLEYKSADWAVYCRAKLYGADGSEQYAETAKQRLRELAETDGFVKPTDFQRLGIILAALGADGSEAAELGAYNNALLGRQGFNAYIWALIAINVTGAEPPENPLNTAESLTDYIISQQHEDGSFALFGDAGDVDITAAAVYALADSGIPEAQQSARRGAEWLAAIDGMYCSLGTPTCESTAQAVIAFCAAGMPEKAQEAALQLEQYRREGGYAHLLDGEVNGLATVQTLEAFTALELSGSGETLFGAALHSAAENPAAAVPGTVENTPEELPNSTEEQAQAVPGNTPAGLAGGQIKLILSIIAGIAAAVCSVCFIIRRKKALIPAAVLLAAVCGGVWLLDIRSPEEYYSGENQGSLLVEISAECTTVLTKMDDIDSAVNPPELIPEDGVVISRCEVSLPEGATAFDALIEAARQQRVRVDYTGASSMGTYVSGIGGIYEFGFGGLSGWMYRVNGEFPDVSSADITLNPGDVVEFVYTCDLGHDVGDDYTAP